MSPVHPAGSQQRPQCCRSACAIVGLNTNGIKRASEALFRAPSVLTSLPWFSFKIEETNIIELKPDSKQRQV